MTRSMKGCLVAGVAIYLVLAAILVALKLLSVRDLHSDPAVSRDTPGFRDGSLGLLKAASRNAEQVRPAATKMEIPARHEGENESFVLEWAKEVSVRQGSPPNPWVSELTGDDALELVAFSTWYPDPGDPVPPESPESLPLVFRGADSLEIISDAELDTLGVPASMRSAEPPSEYHTPRLRLLFRSENMEFVRFNGINVGDARTGARVGYDLESLDELDSRSETNGDWTSIDAALLIWHDSPLKCRIRVLTGEPLRARLIQKPGEQVVFGEVLRIQWLTTLNRDIDVSGYLHNYIPAGKTTSEAGEKLKKRYENQSSRNTRALHVTMEDDEEEVHRTLLRASSDTYLEKHCAILLPDGTANWDWKREEEQGGLFLASTKVTLPTDQEMELLLLPNSTELEFEIAAIPDAPNPREIADLFETKLPRITLPESLSDAESHLIGYISVGAQVEWDSSRKWSDHPPENLPSDNTFRNETPQTLLNWYLENTRGSFIRYDQEDLVLYVNEREENWWTRLLEKISNFNFFVF